MLPQVGLTCMKLFSSCICLCINCIVCFKDKNLLNNDVVFRDFEFFFKLLNFAPTRPLLYYYYLYRKPGVRFSS